MHKRSFQILLLFFFLLSLTGWYSLSAQTDWVKDSLEDVDLHKEWRAKGDWWLQDIEYRHEWDRRHRALTERMLQIKYDSVIYYHYIDALSSIGEDFREIGEWEKALAYFDTCIDLITKQFGPLYRENFVQHSHKAIIYLNKGDYDKALDGWKKGVAVIEANRDSEEYPAQVRNYHHSLGLIYERMGKWEQAVRYYQKAADLALEQESHGRAIADLDRIGYYSLLIGEPEQAQTAFKQIWETVREKMPNAVVPNQYADLRLAAVYVALGKDSLAAAIANRIMPELSYASMHSGQHYTIASALDGLGEQYSKRGIHEEALRFYQKERDIFNYVYSPAFDKTIDATIKVTYTYLALEMVDSAMTECRNVFKTVMPGSDLDNPPANPSEYRLLAGFTLPTVLGQYAKAWRIKFDQSGDLQHLHTALRFSELAATVVDALRKDYYLEGSKQILIARAIELYEGAVQTALKLYEQTGEVRYLETAFAFAEKSKSVLLLESVQGAKAQTFSGMPPELLQREKDLKIDIAFYSKQRYDEQNKKKPDTDKIERWEARALALRNEYDSLLTVLKTQYPDYYALKYDIQYATVAEIQNYLPDARTACIEYFWGKENLYAFVITKAGVRCIPKPLSDELDQRLRRFSYLLSHPDDSPVPDYADHAGYLYDFLLRDALAGADAEHLVIIPDGRLGYLPFQVLIDKRQLEGVDDYRKLPYVINNYEVRYEYSSTLLLAEHAPSQQKGGFLGFAPQYGEGGQGVSVRSAPIDDWDENAENMQLLPLQFTQTEVQQINGLFAGEAFTGTTATEAAFKAEAPKHNILHLAMHAHTSDENPMYSRLVFQQGDANGTEDGLLYAYELYNMNLKADLAVLSACETGAGKLLHGEGIMSLSRAFKFAGCPNIVMSLWQADDASTKDIMVQFYENLRTGKSKAASLREAERTWLQSAPAKKVHPFYWATFVLAGR